MAFRCLDCQQVIIDTADLLAHYTVLCPQRNATLLREFKRMRDAIDGFMIKHDEHLGMERCMELTSITCIGARAIADAESSAEIS